MKKTGIMVAIADEIFWLAVIIALSLVLVVVNMLCKISAPYLRRSRKRTRVRFTDVLWKAGNYNEYYN